MLNGYTFFLLTVARRNSSESFAGFVLPDPVPWFDILHWTVYYTIMVMTIWSLAVMVFKSPGYIPNNYKYDSEKMSQYNRLIH